MADALLPLAGQGWEISLAGRSQCSEIPFLPTEMKGSLDEQLIYQACSAQI